MTANTQRRASLTAALVKIIADVQAHPQEMRAPTFPAPAGMTWKHQTEGYALFDGPNKRACLIPMTPRAHNGYRRWIVDAIRLPRSVSAATLGEAIRTANDNA